MITPCVAICVMNRETNLCEGCARTLSEIGNWFNLSDDEKREIIADLPNREPFAPDPLAPNPLANADGTQKNKD